MAFLPCTMLRDRRPPRLPRAGIGNPTSRRCSRPDVRRLDEEDIHSAGSCPPPGRSVCWGSRCRTPVSAPHDTGGRGGRSVPCDGCQDVGSELSEVQSLALGQAVFTDPGSGQGPELVMTTIGLRVGRSDPRLARMLGAVSVEGDDGHWARGQTHRPVDGGNGAPVEVVPRLQIPHAGNDRWRAGCDWLDGVVPAAAQQRFAELPWTVQYWCGRDHFGLLHRCSRTRSPSWTGAWAPGCLCAGAGRTPARIDCSSVVRSQPLRGRVCLRGKMSAVTRGQDAGSEPAPASDPCAGAVSLDGQHRGHVAESSSGTVSRYFIEGPIRSRHGDEQQLPGMEAPRTVSDR